MNFLARTCRKPKVIRHITTQESEESDDLPEVRLEPDPVDENILEDEEDQVPLEENGEDVEEGTNGEVADDETSEVIEGERNEGEEEEEEEEEVTLVNGDGVKITTDEKGNEVLPDGKEIFLGNYFKPF